MDKKLVNKLNKLIIYLEDVVQVLKEIVAETEEISSKAPQPNAATTMEALVHELKQLSREQAQTRLESLNKRQQIAPLFRHLGSSYSEAKRPKADVIERILQQLFDSAKAREPLLEVSPQVAQPTATATMETLVQELKQGTRKQAQQRLESLNKKQQIAPLFRHLGSSYSEAKRPKAYVIERILQQLFDSAKARKPSLEVSSQVPQPKVTRKIDTLVRELKQLSRKQAQIRLESLNKKQQIEPLFRHLGNSYSEAKRPKAYVIERILWHLFDVSK